MRFFIHMMSCSAYYISFLTNLPECSNTVRFPLGEFNALPRTDLALSPFMDSPWMPGDYPGQAQSPPDRD